MKFEWKDIFKVLKVMLILVGIVFFLSACDMAAEADKGGDATTQTETAAASRITCFQGSIIGILYDAGGHAAISAYTGLTKGALAITMLGFAFWFVFEMLRYLGSFTEQNAAQEWTKVSRQFFMCMVCGMLAQSPTVVLWTLNTLVFPVFYSFLELGSRVLNMASDQNYGDTCVAGEYMHFEKMTCTAPMGNVDGNGFPAGPKQMMSCMICAINDRLSIGYKLSTELMGGGFMNWFSGLVLSVTFIIVKVSFVFYLVDAVFRMTLMIVLFPLLTIAYAFKYTRKWATLGFQIIINCSALVCFIGILLAMVLAAVQKVIEIYNGFGQYVSEDTESGPQVILVLLLAFLVKSSMDVAKAVTDGLVGGGGQAKFASQGAKVLAWVAMRFAAVITSGASSAIEAQMKKHEFTRKILELRDKARKIAGRGGKPKAPQKPSSPKPEGDGKEDKAGSGGKDDKQASGGANPAAGGGAASGGGK